MGRRKKNTSEDSENNVVVSEVEKEIKGSALRKSVIRKKNYLVMTDDLVGVLPSIKEDDDSESEPTKYFKAEFPDKLMKIAKKALENNVNYHFLNANNVKMQFNVVYPAISKTVLAHIIKTSPQLHLNSGLDYIVEASGYALEAMNDEQIAILFEHEFEHLNCTYKNDKKSGEEIPQLNLRKHDVEEFYSIINKYPDWIADANGIAYDVAERIKAS